MRSAHGAILYDTAAATGVGKRGASAIDRLVANGRVANAEVWCVDSDRRALDACAASHTLLLSDQQNSDDVSCSSAPFGIRGTNSPGASAKQIKCSCRTRP